MRILLFYLCGAAWSFSPSAIKSRARRPLYYYPKDFERAVECATKYGRCDCNELGKLADELEEFNDKCFFEKDPDLCEIESIDRLELAELLRLQRDLQLHTECLKKSNLFVSDVQNEHNRHERRDPKSIHWM